VLRRLILTASIASAGVRSGCRVTFLRDVAPILNKSGCTSGPCTRGRGKNGSSSRCEGRSAIRLRKRCSTIRRPPLQRADRQELMLSKPSQSGAGGGQRFGERLGYYRTIYAWMHKESLSAIPRRTPSRPCRSSRRKCCCPSGEAVTASDRQFKDGQTRDVTREPHRVNHARRGEGGQRREVKASASVRRRCIAIRANSPHSQ